MFDTRPYTLFINIALLVTASAHAEIWDIRERSLGAALAYEGKTSDDDRFEGTKLFIDGRYFLNHKKGEISARRECCALPSQPEYFYGLLDAQLRFGFEGTGMAFNLAWNHDKWGTIYINNRFVNGLSFSNPSRGHPMVREAQVTFGYLKQLSGNLWLDIVGEKKSFYFDEGGLPGLYRMSRSVAASIRYHW